MLVWIAILSPIWFEYVDWGRSVPVTFDGNRVVRHNLGLVTIPFLTGPVSNMLVETCSKGLIADVEISDTREQIRVLFYSLSVAIENPERYYLRTERRTYSSMTIEEELGRVADTVLVAFLKANPANIKDFPNALSSDGFAVKNDSVGNVFNAPQLSS